jgi:microcompartment protein CcmK/EutM
VDAGVGDHVIVAYGRAGRTALGQGHDIAVEAAVVAVVDGHTGPELA